MNKKVISLVLALVMVLGTFTSVFAAEKTEEPAKKDAKVEETKKEAPKAGEKVEKVVGKDNKIQYIVDKKFVKGYEDGSMGYDKNITRAEITRLLVLANGNEDLANSLQGAMKLYTDVDTKHWANGVISVGTTRPSDANKIAMLAGYPDKSFKPDKNVTYAELAKMLVVLVKKDLTEDMVKNAKWATSWMLWAKELGILEDVDVKDSNAFATRADAFTMVYNALFAMKEFKQVPNNEVRGILSDLNNNKLQLNQDTSKEYKITENTVFVNSVESRNNIVRVRLMQNYKFYYGSLVRVLVNDKNEVTHILELGNPAEMAVNSLEGTKAPNVVWKGVAKNTAETVTYKIDTLKGTNTSDLKSYVTIDFNDSKISAERINFHFSNNTGINLAIKDSTEVYVANPYNNIMKKVSGINEALSLIGFQNYKGYKIPNVYAGYDNSSLNPTYGELRVGTEKHIAKVIVFNVVSKEAKSELYRVINTTRSNYITTVENTDGKRFERNNSSNTFGFPFNYDGDLYDVIKVLGWRSNQDAEIMIDHSDVAKYPVVKVVYANDDELRIVDRYNDYTTLDIRDADIFTKLNKLENGSVIQFRVENHKTDKANNVAEIISILPKDTALEGSIKGVLPMVNAKQRVGKIIEVRPVDGLYSNVVIDVERDLLDADAMSGPTLFRVNKAVAEKLATFARKADMFAFKVDYVYTDKGVQTAYDFRYNATNKPVEVAEVNSDMTQAEKNARYQLNKFKAEPDTVAEGTVTTEINKVEDLAKQDALKQELAAYKALYTDASAKLGTLNGLAGAAITEQAIKDAEEAVAKLANGKYKTDSLKAIADKKAEKAAADKDAEIATLKASIGLLAPEANKNANSSIQNANILKAVNEKLATLKVPANVTIKALTTADIGTVAGTTVPVTVTVETTVSGVTSPQTQVVNVTLK